MAWFGEISGKLFGLDIDFGKQPESQTPPPPPPVSSGAGSSWTKAMGGMMPLILVGALIYILVRK